MHENLPLDSRRTFEKKLLEKFFLQTGPFPLLFSENSLRFSYLVIYVIKIRYLFFSGMLFVNYNLFFRLSLIANFCKNHGWQMQETPMTNFCKKKLCLCCMMQYFLLSNSGTYLLLGILKTFIPFTRKGLVYHWLFQKVLISSYSQIWFKDNCHLLILFK